MFLMWSGKPISPNNVASLDLSGVRYAAGLKRVGWLTLRRTYLVLDAREGCPASSHFWPSLRERMPRATW